MIGRMDEAVPDPIPAVRPVTQGAVIKATWNGVLDLLKKKGVKENDGLMRLAKTLQGGEKAAEKMAPEDAAVVQQCFSEQAQQAQAMTQAPRARAPRPLMPLPGSYRRTEDLVAAATAEELLPQPRMDVQAAALARAQHAAHEYAANNKPIEHLPPRGRRIIMPEGDSNAAP